RKLSHCPLQDHAPLRDDFRAWLSPKQTLHWACQSQATKPCRLRCLESSPFIISLTRAQPPVSQPPRQPSRSVQGLLYETQTARSRPSPAAKDGSWASPAQPASM